VDNIILGPHKWEVTYWWRTLDELLMHADYFLETWTN